MKMEYNHEFEAPDRFLCNKLILFQQQCFGAHGGFSNPGFIHGIRIIQ